MKFLYVSILSVGQMKGSRVSLVLVHSDFLYAQELTEVPVLGSKGTFLAKGRDSFQMSPLNVSSAVGVALIGVGEPPLITPGCGGATTVRRACFFCAGARKGVLFQKVLHSALSLGRGRASPSVEWNYLQNCFLS